MASAGLCLVLLVSELLSFSRVEVVNHMTVDSTPSAGTVPINFHITFPLVDCKGKKIVDDACIYPRLPLVVCMYNIDDDSIPPFFHHG